MWKWTVHIHQQGQIDGYAYHVRLPRAVTNSRKSWSAVTGAVAKNLGLGEQDLSFGDQLLGCRCLELGSSVL